MSEEQTESRERDEPQDRGQDDEAAKARKMQEESEEAKEEIKALEDDPPENLEDWPDGRAKYETFGGQEHDSTYEEAATAKLGPADVRHHEDGSVSVGGEKVDNPEDYKGEPIPGGPTDPDAPKVSGEKDLTGEGDQDQDQDQDDQDREGSEED